MREEQKINRELFTDDKRVLRMANILGKEELREVLVFLEIYSLQSNAEICSSLIENFNVPNNIQYIATVIDSSNTPSELLELKSFGVILTNYFDNKAVVAFDVTRPVNKAMLENSFRNVGFIYIPVTPYNYIKLTMTEDEIIDNYMSAEGAVFRLALEGYMRSATDMVMKTIHINGETTVQTLLKLQGGYRRMNLFPINEKLAIKYSEVIAKMALRDSDDVDSGPGLQSDIADIFGDGELALRVVGTPTVRGHYVNCRLLTRNYTSKTVDQLGFDSDTVKQLKFLEHKKSGLTLFGGVTGSGKSTTLYSMLNSIVENNKLGEPNVIEIGSPVEVLMPWTQWVYNGSVDQLHHKVVLLKKSDPEIVLLTEIADKKTADDVLDIVNSGSLVMSTLHINRTYELPMKLFNYFGDQYKSILLQMNAIVLQVKMIENCKDCRVTKAIDLSVLPREQAEFCIKKGIIAYSEGTGCPTCGNTGYAKSIQPYLEMVVFTRELKDKLLLTKDYIDMIPIMKNELKLQESDIETKVANAIKSGVLNLTALDRIF